jgi:hypothetical protein
MIRFKNLRGCSEDGAVFHCKTWPDSIVSKYLKSQEDLTESGFIPWPPITDKDYIDLESLVEIISGFPENLKPKDNELVIHLRVGDIIDKSDLSVGQILDGKKSKLSKGGHLNKTMTFSFYKDLLLKKINISKIILMTGSSTHNIEGNHAGRSIAARKKQGKASKSKGYVNIIKRFFEKSGYLVETRSGFSPDEDFVFACRAKMFISSRSGFSIVIEKVRKHLRITDPSIKGLGYGIGKSSN